VVKLGQRVHPGVKSAALIAAAAFIAVALALVPARAGADNAVTFSSTQVLPVPPASDYAGQGGGDGWAISLRGDAGQGHPAEVFNVFHHDSTLTVACHKQVDASNCWDPVTLNSLASVAQANVTFSGTAEPGTYLDPATSKLYVYTTETHIVNDRTVLTAGVVCFDTLVADSGGDPYCGFTPLSADGDAESNSYSNVSNPVQVGSRWFAFNFFDGAGVTGTKNTLLCFDTTTLKACAGQPFTVALGLGDGVANVSQPPPPIASAGTQIFVPINGGESSHIGCLDAKDGGAAGCSGQWPVADTSGLIGSVGAPVPLLTASGQPNGICLPSGQMPCWDLSGNPVTPPDALVQAIAATGSSVYWNGPAVQLGPRIYVPKWSTQVNCYDFNTNAGCPGYPKQFSGLSLLYTVNVDPQRPTCLWVNSDSGESQIQSFDAFTGGACGEGPIRLPGSFFVVDAPECTPGSYTSLQVTNPQNPSGSVTFADVSGNPLTANPVQLDATGTADLRGLDLTTKNGLPQFLITLNRGDNAPPTSVTVKLTWTGNFDGNCAKGAGDKPTTTTTTTTAPPALSNVGVTVAAPIDARVGQPATFTATVKNTGQDPAQGVELTSSIIGAASVNSVTSSQGTCITGTAVHCYLGTLAPGASATVRYSLTPTASGTLTVSARVAGDHNTFGGDDNASASTPGLDPGAPPPAPPAPTEPGTVNAISVGTVKVNGVVIPPDTVFLLRSGDTVELNGFLTFTTIGGAVGTFSNVPFTVSRSLSGYRALLRSAVDGPPTRFTVSAPSDAAGLTNLTLVDSDFTGCTSPRTVSATKPSSKVVQQLWGKAKGKFRTTAKYSSATIRGTTWGIQDRCDGSLTTALDDPVDVFDSVLNKTVTITGGQTYLAQPGAFKPPTVKKHPVVNTNAAVAKRIAAHGLRWGNVIYKTKAELTAWLESRGRTWASFAAKYPTLAKALAARRK
jgi:uncharacterized repeat protein (TIGR01451 family)